MHESVHVRRGIAEEQSDFMGEILPVAKAGNQLGNAAAGIPAGIPAFGKQPRGQVAPEILLQHLRPVKVHQRAAFVPSKGENAEVAWWPPERLSRSFAKV